MADRTYYGSRYAIKYHNNNSKFSFYLSGATFEDRQIKYTRLRDLLIDLQNLEDVPVNYNVNGDILQDINADVFSIRLVQDRTNHFARIKIKPKLLIKRLWRRYFPEDEVDFGVVPSDKTFDSSIIRFYRSMSDEQKSSAIKLHTMKFNAWNSDKILLGISFSMEGIHFEMPDGMKEVVSEIRRPETVLPVPEINETMVEDEVFGVNQNIIIKSFDDMIKSVCAEFASIFLINKLSTI